MRLATPAPFANTIGGAGVTVPPTENATGRVAPVRDLVAGDTVGDYRIEGLLGEGGMGQVYSAVHPVIGKKAAVKVLRAELCTQVEIVERFVQEARAVNQIGHPNIVDIFTLGTLPDGRSYLVMEWLSGEALNTRIHREPLTREELCHFGDSIARALDAAHEKNIVHRDLKPENIYLQAIRGERPVIKLLDFGIAKLTGNGEQRLERTRTGTMMGTPMYIAPEQARGQSVDHRADIYSLGVMFFEFVARRLPFEAENAMDLIIKHLQEAAPSLCALDASIPPLFDELVQQMMAKDPNDRPTLKHVREVLTALSCMPEWYEANAEVVPLTASLRTGVIRHMTPRPTPLPVQSPRLPSELADDDEPITAPRGKGKWIALGVAGALAAGTLAFVLTRPKHATPVPQAAPSPVPSPVPSPTAVPAAPPNVPAAAPPAPVVQPAVVQPAVAAPPTAVAPPSAPTPHDGKPTHGTHGTHHGASTTSPGDGPESAPQASPITAPPPALSHPVAPPPAVTAPPVTAPPPTPHPAPPPKGPDSALEGRT